MILWAILLGQLAGRTAVTVEYRDVATEVVSVSIYQWSDTKPPSLMTSQALNAERTLGVAEPPGVRTVVIFKRSDGRYLIDGPFDWPTRDTARTADRVWRRTVTGARPAGLQSAPPLEWMSSRSMDETWPQCRWAGPDRWDCWGTSDETAGVVVASDAGRVWWCTVRRAEIGEWHASEWARLIVIGGPDGGAPSNVSVDMQRPVAPPAYRFKDVRLDSAPVPSTTATLLSPGSVWVAGVQPPDRSWLSIRARDAAPAFVPLADVAAGAAMIPERLTLEPARRFEGTVSAGTQPAARTTVTLFRLIDPPPGPNDRIKPRRVFEAETTADDNGAFAFDSIGNGDHELVAWHPQLGRSSILLQPGQRSAAIRLDSVGVARGRVLVGGKPAPGVEVFSVPDAKAFAGADDPVDLKGGDGTTDSDGRFVVSLAPSGGGELRIGGRDLATKRLPLPAMPLPIVDFGDIELAAPLTIHVVLDSDSACDVVATGPIGRLGLQVVAAERTGPGLFQISLAEEGQWEFGLDCAGTIRPLTPAIVSIMNAMNGKEVRLGVPRGRY